MSASEALILLEFHRPKRIGNLHEDEFDKLAELREKLEKQGVKVL